MTPVCWSFVTRRREMRRQGAVEFRRRARVRGVDAHVRVLADGELVDVLRHHLRLEIEGLRSTGTISIAGSAGEITPPTVWTASWCT